MATITKTIKTGKRIVKPKGNSIWIDNFTMPITITGIDVECDLDDEPKNPYVLVWVYHNGPWQVYTDTGFEKGISEIMSEKLGFGVKVSFTEQGMQESGVASMEYANMVTARALFKWLKN